MNQLYIYIAVTALVAAATSGNSQAERLTENSIRRFLEHRDTLMVQGDADQIGTLFDTNATVIFGSATIPDVEHEMNIESTPEPVNSKKAYAKGGLARILSHSGDKERANQLRKEAEALDPNFSKAPGIPDQNLYIPLDQIPRGFTYFSRPF